MSHDSAGTYVYGELCFVINYYFLFLKKAFNIPVRSVSRASFCVMATVWDGIHSSDYGHVARISLRRKPLCSYMRYLKPDSFHATCIDVTFKFGRIPLYLQCNLGLSGRSCGPVIFHLATSLAGSGNRLFQWVTQKVDAGQCRPVCRFCLACPAPRLVSGNV